MPNHLGECCFPLFGICFRIGERLETGVVLSNLEVEAELTYGSILPRAIPASIKLELLAALIIAAIPPDIAELDELDETVVVGLDICIYQADINLGLCNYKLR